MERYYEVFGQTRARLERHLEGCFPATPFESIPVPRSDGRHNLAIRWQDGPSVDEVLDIASQFESVERHWDDGDLIEVPQDTVIAREDGSVALVQGAIVRCVPVRSLSREFAEPVVREVADRMGLKPLPLVRDPMFGTMPDFSSVTSQAELDLVLAISAELGRRSAIDPQ